MPGKISIDNNAHWVTVSGKQADPSRRKDQESRVNLCRICGDKVHHPQEGLPCGTGRATHLPYKGETVFQGRQLLSRMTSFERRRNELKNYDELTGRLSQRSPTMMAQALRTQSWFWCLTFRLVYLDMKTKMSRIWI